MSERVAVPPIAGPGSEVLTLMHGYAYCGACGFTGRVETDRHRECSESIWHAYLKAAVDLLPRNL